MDQIHVTLPDGKVHEVPKGTTPLEIARKISPRLADAALVARISTGNGVPTTNAADQSELIDLRRPLDYDVKLQILTEKDADALYVFRHSAAHLLAAAVTELFPDVKLGIGPPIDTGFFYEFLREEPFTPEDLVKIEAKMRQLAAQDLPNERKLLSKPEASSCTKKLIRPSSASLWKKKRPSRWFPFTPPGNLSIFAAARTFRPPSASLRSS